MSTASLTTQFDLNFVCNLKTIQHPIPYEKGMDAFNTIIHFTQLAHCST